MSIAGIETRAERLLRLVAGLALCALASAASAHQASEAYIDVQVQAERVDVRWDVALRDLDAMLPLDADGDRRLTWGELRRALPRVRSVLLPQIGIAGCPLAWQGSSLERRADGVYAAIELRSDCRAPAGVPIEYRWMAGVDATHRAVARLRFADGRTEVRLLDPHAVAPAAAAGTEPALGSSFLVEGVRHLLTGYDHLLFLLCLLLPAVLRRKDGRWVPVMRARDAVAPVLTTVTLFTLAHSLTLVLAALGHVRLAPSFVEPAIAVTIGLAAIDNVRSIFGRWRQAVAFGFGLIHGFGFAGVLGELDLPALDFGWALLQFNLGLELGQLMVVMFAVPLLAWLRHRLLYPRLVLQGGSAVVIVMAVVWLIERISSAPLA